MGRDGTLRAMTSPAGSRPRAAGADETVAARIGPEVLRVERGRGGVSVHEVADPTALLIRPWGYVRPAMVRDVLALAEGFAARHPEGWSWVVDGRNVRMAHPANPFLLRRVQTLPALHRYVVVAPPLLHALFGLVHRYVGANRITRTEEEAFALCREGAPAA